MRSPDRSEIYEYVRTHPDTDVRRITEDLFPGATPYETRYMKIRIAHHLTNLRKERRITVSVQGRKGHVNFWRAVE